MTACVIKAEMIHLTTICLKGITKSQISIRSMCHGTSAAECFKHSSCGCVDLFLFVLNTGLMQEPLSVSSPLLSSSPPVSLPLLLFPLLSSSSSSSSSLFSHPPFSSHHSPPKIIQSLFSVPHLSNPPIYKIRPKLFC